MATNVRVIHARDFIRATPDHACFFSLCAENRGCNVAAFHSYEDAMEWLIG